MSQNKSFFTIITSICILSPTALWATRGPDDYGIIISFMFITYAFPVGLMLLGFIIYTFAKLKSMTRPGKNACKIIYTISIITIPFTVIIPVFWILWSDCHKEMIELMLAEFIPLLILSITSIALAMRVRKSSSLSESDFKEKTETIRNKKSDAGNKHNKFFIACLILFIFILLAFVFKFCFTG